MSEHQTPRRADRHRITGETDVTLRLDLDGTGHSTIDSGVGFFDHMLTALSKHALLDLDVSARGDLHIDCHHTVEDIGIALGEALREAIGDKRGISRFGHALVPLDEALCEAVVDVSGRPFLAWSVTFPRERVGEMDTDLFEEFFRALAMGSGLTIHINNRYGTNAHHIAESAFKAFARALRMALTPDARAINAIPSTKGVL